MFKVLKKLLPSVNISRFKLLDLEHIDKVRKGCYFTTINLNLFLRDFAARNQELPRKRIFSPGFHLSKAVEKMKKIQSEAEISLFE